MKKPKLSIEDKKFLKKLKAKINKQFDDMYREWKSELAKL